ncbi:PH domain-containing protein [Macrococcus equi]|uniref:PH domain-containing protein n=1 Tax=Macrococcus equi TaxID=3395462 RepID=UPI0039BDADC8
MEAIILYFDTLKDAQPANTPNYRRLKWSIYTFLTIILCTLLYLGMDRWFEWQYAYLVFLLMLIPIYTLILGIYLSFRMTRYELKASTLEISSGAYFMGRKIIPVDLMQSVKIEQGFIMKRFNLALITVYTRGDMVVLPYMQTQEAEIVADRILTRIKEIHYEHN